MRWKFGSSACQLVLEGYGRRNKSFGPGPCFELFEAGTELTLDPLETSLQTHWKLYMPAWTSLEALTLRKPLRAGPGHNGRCVAF